MEKTALHYETVQVLPKSKQPILRWKRELLAACGFVYTVYSISQITAK